MKKSILILTASLLICLSSCDIVISTSQDNSENVNESEILSFSSSESVSEMIDSNSQSSYEDISSEIEQDSSEAKTLNDPTLFYTISGDDIFETYFQGEEMPLGNVWTNYIVLDGKGRIVYTVANVGCGYGSNYNYASINYYYDSIEKDISNNNFIVPGGCTGYSVSYQGYGQLVYDITNKEISKSEFEENGYGNTIKEWNSINNPYITDNIGITIGEKTVTELEVRNDSAIRLSTIHDQSASNGINTYKLTVPYNDKYTITCKNATKLELYNKAQSLISSGTSSLSVSLKENDLVYLSISYAANSTFTAKVAKEKYDVELPYKIYTTIDKSAFSTTGSTTNPLKSCNIKYTKRANSTRAMYINENNPEALDSSNLNTCLTSQDITEKDVFFTFENNNIATNYYYGYRVTNTGSSDLYVTVKNLGYQVKGAGSWLGEDEWIKFYNTKFDANTSGLTSSQKSNYDAYIGFSGAYTSGNRQPVTYRIPQGKYIYVMGGTSEDAYDNTNVFSSANQVVNGGCSNGAVLFETHGSKAFGQFIVYQSGKANSITTSTKQTGYVTTQNGKNVGSQYVGYDNCDGVVDADLYWTFNDATPNQDLPVSYKNNYYNGNVKGTKFSKISTFYPKSYTNATEWFTHINPNGHLQAVGTDMTKYITIDHETGNNIVIDYEHYDGNGNTVNIGNWMVDYQDNVYLVNQGNSSRKVTYSLKHNGVILAFVRNEDGTISSTYNPTYCPIIATSSYGAAISRPFTYTVTIPAHSSVFFTVEYNLLANSYGCISHKINLSK